jgi:hypothetical protein
MNAKWGENQQKKKENKFLFIFMFCNQIYVELEMCEGMQFLVLERKIEKLFHFIWLRV